MTMISDSQIRLEWIRMFRLQGYDAFGCHSFGILLDAC